VVIRDALFDTPASAICDGVSANEPASTISGGLEETPRGLDVIQASRPRPN